VYEEATAALFFDLDRRENPEGVVVRHALREYLSGFPVSLD